MKFYVTSASTFRGEDLQDEYKDFCQEEEVMYRYMYPVEVIEELKRIDPDCKIVKSYKSGVDVVHKNFPVDEDDNEVEFALWDTPGVRYYTDLKSLVSLMAFVDEVGGHISIHRRGGWNSSPTFDDEESCAAIFGEPDIGDDSAIILIEDFLPEVIVEEGEIGESDEL